MRAEHSAALLVMFTAIKNGHATVQLSSNPVGTTSVKLCLQFVDRRITKEFVRTRVNMSVRSRSNLNLKVLAIEEMGKSVGPRGRTNNKLNPHDTDNGI